MLLYHSTYIENLDSILSNGISPKKDRGNTFIDTPSIDGLVYLSTTNAGYYANLLGTNPNREVVVFEVDVSSNRLLLDDDLLYQLLFDHDESLEDLYDLINKSDIKKLKKLVDLYLAAGGAETFMKYYSRSNSKIIKSLFINLKSYSRLSLDYLGSCTHIGKISNKKIVKYSKVNISAMKKRYTIPEYITIEDHLKNRIKYAILTQYDLWEKPISKGVVYV